MIEALLPVIAWNPRTKYLAEGPRPVGWVSTNQFLPQTQFRYVVGAGPPGVLPFFGEYPSRLRSAVSVNSWTQALSLRANRGRKTLSSNGR